MTKPITHLMDKQFKNICGNSRRNTDGSSWWKFVTCKACLKQKPRKSK